ncbi:MAG: carbohydrate kinase family protein [Caldisericia bacterium]
MKKNVIVFGDNCIDINIKIKEENFNFHPDSNHHMKKLKIKSGGTGINFSISLSSFGTNTYYYGSISKDDFGKKIFKQLKKYKVNIDLINFSNKKTAIIIIVLNKNGERVSFANLKNASYHYIDFNNIKKIDLKKIDAVYISGGILTERDFNKKFLEFIDENFPDKKIFFDLNYRIGKGIKYFKEYAFKFMERSFLIFTNEDEFKIIGRKNVNNLINNGKILIVKMGEKGAKLLKKDEEIYIKGYEVKSIDTVGAGDIFDALFIHKYLENENLKESLNFANYFAAISTTKFGFYIPDINKKI